MPQLVLLAVLGIGTLGAGAWVVHAIRAPAIAEANALAAVAAKNAEEARTYRLNVERAQEAAESARAALEAERQKVRVEVRRIPVYPEGDPCAACTLDWGSPSSPDAPAPPAPSSD